MEADKSQVLSGEKHCGANYMKGFVADKNGFTSFKFGSKYMAFPSPFLGRRADSMCS